MLWFGPKPQSSGAFLCGLVPNRTPRIAAARTRLTTTLTAKITRQSETARITAAYSGPITLPSSCTADTTPRARPAFDGVQVGDQRERGRDEPTAPTPCRKRPTTRLGRSYAAAVTSEPTAKSTSAATSTGTRPRRSAIRPINGSMATYPSRKPETMGAPRWSWSMGMPADSIMSGRASTTT